MGERTLNKNKQTPSQKFDDRAGTIRFGTTDATTPEENGGPNKRYVEVQLVGAGSHWLRKTEDDIPQPVLAWLNELCDEAADELEG